MGGNSSKKANGDSRCRLCGFSGKAVQAGKAPHLWLYCARCHGKVDDAPSSSADSANASPPALARRSILNPLSSASSSSSSSSSSTSPSAAGGGYVALSPGGSEMKEAHEASSSSAATFRCPLLERVHIAPFFETLPPAHQALASSLHYEQDMLRLYLTDYFAAQASKINSSSAVYVTVGTRFQIKEVDWKVTSAYPPSGWLGPKTSVRCMERPLSAVAQIQKMHVLPVRATLPFTMRDGVRVYDVPDSNRLFSDYIRPWIASESSSAAAGGRRSSSSAGSSSSTAAADAASSSSSMTSGTQAQYPGSAAAASSSSSSSSSNQAHAEFEPKHVVEGDLFVSRGVQFKIVSCLPSNGVITNATEIFSSGEPLADVQRLQINAIYESLPNSEKEWTGQQFFQKYLLPYFQGRFPYIHQGQVIEIDGVSFKIVASEPDAGLATVDTLIYSDGAPLRAEDLRRQQLAEDEAMARSLQMQESHVHGRQPMMMRRMGAGQQHGYLTPGEMRARLQVVLRLMPPQDPHRPIVQHLYEQLGQLPPDAQLQGADQGLMQLFRGVGGAEPNRGAAQQDIDALPTRIHRAPAAGSATADAAPASEVDKEKSTCMVCLTEFEEAEELRTLPCFHSFHRGCIDPWLQRNAVCPVCRFSVRGS